MKNRNGIFATLLLALGCLAVSPTAQAVNPPPDGGYAGNNTAEGTSALFSLTSGIDNTALGFQTLFHNNTGNSNTAEGFRALFANTNGHQNTATGVSALLSNTTGNFNTANGVNALNHNIDGGNNTASGVQALFSNTSGNFNTATGVAALFHNTTGSANCAFGNNTLFNNTSGVNNTAAGVSALSSNNTGSNNTANGTAALALNHGGIDNTAIGAEALLSNFSGSFNTAIGWEALVANNSGGANTAVGYQALRNATGANNTAIGNSAGANVTTGSFNVYLGAGLGGVPDEVGHTYISNISSTVQPPGGNVEYVTINLDTKLLGHSSSSRRYKEDIRPMTNVSEALYRLKPVTYRHRKEIDFKQSAAFGLIAEDVAEVNPALVARNPKGQPESVHYEMVNAMLLNEFLKEHERVQEQAARIAEIKAIVAKQEKGMEALAAHIRDQDAKIQSVSAETKIGRPAPKVVINQRQTRTAD